MQCHVGGTAVHRHAITNGSEANNSKFVLLCCDLYKIIRRHGNRFIGQFSMMLDAGAARRPPLRLPAPALTPPGRGEAAYTRWRDSDSVAASWPPVYDHDRASTYWWIRAFWVSSGTGL